MIFIGVCFTHCVVVFCGESSLKDHGGAEYGGEYGVLDRFIQRQGGFGKNLLALRCFGRLVVDSGILCSGICCYKKHSESQHL